MNEQFENARGFYAAVMQDLEEIAVSLKNFFRTQGQEFNTDLFYRQYDCLLQYSLLHTAIIDNDFDLNEVVFIRDLTEHADLMDYLNSICDTDFSWQLIFKGEIAAISTWLSAIRPLMDSVKEDFCAFFALYDAASPKDYLQNLVKNTSFILAALACSDGKISEKEKDTSGNYILDVFSDISDNIKGFQNK